MAKVKSNSSLARAKGAEQLLLPRKGTKAEKKETDTKQTDKDPVPNKNGGSNSSKEKKRNTRRRLWGGAHSR